MSGKPGRAAEYIRTHGAAYTLRRAAEKAGDRLLHASDRVWRQHRCGETELARQRAEKPEAGLISVCIPVWNTKPEFLLELAESLAAQTYPDWEACLYDGCSTDPATKAALRAASALDSRIRVCAGTVNDGIAGNTNRAITMARGGWIALCDHDDLLAPEALYLLADTIVRERADMVYSDEDRISEDGRFHADPHFKPDFAPDNLRSGNYVCHLLAVRTDLVRAVGGLRPGFDGSQDHDLALRCAERAQCVAHVPHILYHWREFSHSMSHRQRERCLDAGRRAVAEQAERIGWPASVSVENGLYRVSYAIKGTPSVRILLQEDGSGAAALGARFADAPQPVRVTACGQDAASLNTAAQAAEEDFLLFLHPGVVIPADAAGWLNELLMHAQRDGVGAVSPVLTDARGRIVHAGFTVRENGAAGIQTGLPLKAGGWRGMAWQVRDVCAVGLACVMIRRDRFVPLDTRYTGGLAAVDACLRLGERKLLCVVTPFAAAVCRGAEDLLLRRVPKADAALFARMHAGYADPYMNPNFDPRKADYTIRRSAERGTRHGI